MMTWAKRGLGVLLLAGVGAAAMGGCGPSAMARMGTQIADRNKAVEQAEEVCKQAKVAEGVAACEKYLAAVEAMALVSLGENAKEPSTCSTLIEKGDEGSGDLAWCEGIGSCRARGPAVAFSRACFVSVAQGLLQAIRKQVDDAQRVRREEGARNAEFRAAAEASQKEKEVSSRTYGQNQLMERAVNSCTNRWIRTDEGCENTYLSTEQRLECARKCAEAADVGIRSAVVQATEACAKSDSDRASACAVETGDRDPQAAAQVVRDSSGNYSLILQGHRDPQAAAQVVRECKTACPAARAERKKRDREVARARSVTAAQEREQAQAEERARRKAEVRERDQARAEERERKEAEERGREQARAARRQCVAQCAQTERSCKKECEPLVAAKGNCEYRCEVARRDCELGC